MRKEKGLQMVSATCLFLNLVFMASSLALSCDSPATCPRLSPCLRLKCCRNTPVFCPLVFRSASSVPTSHAPAGGADEQAASLPHLLCSQALPLLLTCQLAFSITVFEKCPGGPIKSINAMS